jgi:hypothetical protein
MCFAFLGVWVRMYVCCAHQNSYRILLAMVTEWGDGGATHVAFLLGCGFKNSTTKLPPNRWNGPAMMGSSRPVDGGISIN